MTENCPPNSSDELEAENERLRTELATARETNRSLNRRCQLAERAASEKVTASTGSLGRGLANYAASMYVRELTEARAELETLTAEQTEFFETLRLYKASYENREKGQEHMAVHDAFRHQLFAALEPEPDAQQPTEGETATADGYAAFDDPAIKPEALEDREGP